VQTIVNEAIWDLEYQNENVSLRGKKCHVGSKQGGRNLYLH
jgi:hypothetical protein